MNTNDFHTNYADELAQAKSMQTYYIIVENTFEVIEVGEFASNIEAEQYVSERADNLSHGESYICIEHFQLKRLMNTIFNVVKPK